MASMARRYGTKWWWSFFQSCHGMLLVGGSHFLTFLAYTGKGMHDGAGAWLKASAARACLAGVGISSVEDFFHFCQQFLNTNMSNRNFTSGTALIFLILLLTFDAAERHFYLISVELIASYRASMPSLVR